MRGCSSAGGVEDDPLLVAAAAQLATFAAMGLLCFGRFGDLEAGLEGHKERADGTDEDGIHVCGMWRCGSVKEVTRRAQVRGKEECKGGKYVHARERGNQGEKAANSHAAAAVGV